MDKGINKAITDFVSTVAGKNKKLIAAYLFGSYARDNQQPESDIDIALVIDPLTDHEKFDMQIQLMMLAAQFDTRIEPHPISKSDFLSGNPFAAEIKRTGIEIKPGLSNKVFVP